MVANGTLVWYYHICKRQVWLMGHCIGPEHENPLMAEGRSMRGNVILEVKKSSKS